MAQICVVCRTSIAADSVFCANCGARQPEPGTASDHPPALGGESARPEEAADRHDVAEVGGEEEGIRAVSIDF